MTPNQRMVKISNIKGVLVDNGWSEDRWGNFKKDCNTGLYRVKFTKTAVRLETRINTSWINLRSDYVKNVTVTLIDFKIKGASVSNYK